MHWNYRIVKHTIDDCEGDLLAEVRKGAPFYGLYEVYYNEDGTLASRNQYPFLSYDTYLEDEPLDPRGAFKDMLAQILADVDKDIVFEPYQWEGFREPEQPKRWEAPPMPEVTFTYVTDTAMHDEAPIYIASVKVPSPGVCMSEGKTLLQALYAIQEAWALHCDSMKESMTDGE